MLKPMKFEQPPEGPVALSAEEAWRVYKALHLAVYQDFSDTFDALDGEEEALTIMEAALSRHACGRASDASATR